MKIRRALIDSLWAALPLFAGGAVLLLANRLLADSLILAKVGFYLLGLACLMLVAILFVRTQTTVAVKQVMQSAYAWLLFWHVCVMAIVAVGAFIGGLLFPLVGSLARLDYSLWVMIRRGLLDGGFYALVWGPGIGFVVCAIRAKKMGMHPWRRRQ